MKRKTIITIMSILIISLFMIGCKDKGPKIYKVNLLVDGELFQTIELEKDQILNKRQLYILTVNTLERYLGRELK